MLRAARIVGKPAGRAAVRVSHRRLATEVPSAVPKKKRHLLRKFIVYTTGATATFYVSSAFIAFNNQQYHDFFIENVPLGASFLQYTEDHDWDTLTLEKVIEYSKDGITYVQGLLNRETGTKVVEKTKEAIEHTKEVSKDRLHTVSESLKTTVHKVEGKFSEQSSKQIALAKHREIQFSEGVEELARKAEDALAGKPFVPVPSTEVPTTPQQPEIPTSIPSAETESEASADEAKEKGKNVYNAPLPIGFEPPPGYAKPSAPKAAKSATTKRAGEAASSPLPLVAPAVAEFGASEPVIAQLASVIDDLASYLNSNPTAAEKARDVLDTAKVDLTQLATRIDQVKEDERVKLEAALEEKSKDYNMKLIELEMEAQDKLDNQSESFRKYFEEERVKFVNAYREKLNKELQTQSEIINQRLKEEVVAQGIELQRRWIREIKVRVEQERGGRLAKLDELASNLKRLEP
ncbi:hypothetical protein NM688_g2299 [Phlebia brevispora]|uniref:Uncharacterized protein n=1 Tax=Phlebia brevispora TaxID=194682 RepID=A0ACC1T8W1_9APHY|nr:hypothetical protein NM688_g2299 [Phlebia brevispora]